MVSLLVFRLLFIIFSMMLIASILESPIAQCSSSNNNNKLTPDYLIRRDYPQISNNDVSSSKSEEYFNALAKSIDRSFSRAAYLNRIISKPSTLSTVITSPLTRVDGDFAMEVNIGSPPVRITGIMDTAHDLTWTQCKPCVQCYQQKDPLFDPNQTSTYRHLDCDSHQCLALHKQFTFCGRPQCSFELVYLNGVIAIGDLAVDTFTFPTTDGKNISFPNTVFGCGHNNTGNFSGVIGLGKGNASIINQFSPKINRKFSYCLTPVDKPSSRSKISLGVNALPPGSKAVSTSFVQLDTPQELPDSFYVIGLEGISVGKGNGSHDYHRIDAFKPSSSPQEDEEPEMGVMLIDAGTTLTYLNVEIVADVIVGLLGAVKGNRTTDPIRKGLDPCYIKEPGLEIPDLVFHFTDADVVLPPENVFIQVSESVVCSTIKGTFEAMPVFGNIAQTNYLIEYDLDNEKISFLPTDCTKELLL